MTLTHSSSLVLLLCYEGMIEQHNVKSKIGTASSCPLMWETETWILMVTHSITSSHDMDPSMVIPSTTRCVHSEL